MTDELITYRDDGAGERAGLSASALGTWTAATASLLTDECGLGPGAQVAVLLPPHWQTAAVLLGAWSAGIEVSFRGWATAGLSPAGPALDASFVDFARIGSWLDTVPSARHQFALFGTGETDGYHDFLTAVRPHLGAAPPALTDEPDHAASTDGTTYGEYGAIAQEIAAMNGITAGDRVLVDVAVTEQPLTWLLAPLSAGASIVLVKNADQDIIASEKITRVLQ